MEFKGTKGKWKLANNHYGYFTSVRNSDDTRKICVSRVNNMTESNANMLLISKAPEMLEIIEELCENLSFQLDRVGVCGEGDGKGRKADVDSYGGTELLQRAKQLIKEVTEI